MGAIRKTSYNNRFLDKDALTTKDYRKTPNNSHDKAHYQNNDYAKYVCSFLNTKAYKQNTVIQE